MKLAYKLAEAQVKYYPEQLRPNEKPTVFVYSDGRVSDAKELSVQADIRYTKIGRDDTSNIAIVSLSAKRNYERPTEVQVFARLANFGPEMRSFHFSIGLPVVLVVISSTFSMVVWYRPSGTRSKSSTAGASAYA